MCYTNKEHNVPWIHNGRRMPWWLTFSQVWGTAHEGRFFKRRLSKVRRRAWKDEILRGHRPRGLPGAESTVNWKNW